MQLHDRKVGAVMCSRDIQAKGRQWGGRAIFVASVLLGALLGSVYYESQIADAHQHASLANTYYDHEWNADSVFKFGASTSPLTGTTYKNTVINGFNAFNLRAGSIEIQHAASSDNPNWQYVNDCNSYIDVWIYSRNLDPIYGAILGRSSQCVNGQGAIEIGNLQFNSNRTWEISSAVPASNERDLLGVATHEAGHLFGFGVGAATNHFMNNSDHIFCYPISDVTNRPNSSTMCGADNPGETTYSNGEYWKRGLRPHEAAMFDIIYP